MEVLSLKATTGNNVAYPLGEKVAGYVTITSDRIWLLFVDSTRKTPATPALTDAAGIGQAFGVAVFNNHPTSRYSLPRLGLSLGSLKS